MPCSAVTYIAIPSFLHFLSNSVFCFSFLHLYRRRSTEYICVWAIPSFLPSAFVTQKKKYQTIFKLSLPSFFLSFFFFPHSFVVHRKKHRIYMWSISPSLPSFLSFFIHSTEEIQITIYISNPFLPSSLSLTGLRVTIKSPKQTHYSGITWWVYSMSKATRPFANSTT